MESDEITPGRQLSLRARWLTKTLRGGYRRAAMAAPRQSSLRQLRLPDSLGSLVQPPMVTKTVDLRTLPVRARVGWDSGGRLMGVFIIREMVGTSPRSWSDAARQAVVTASNTVRNIREIEVVKSSATVVDGQISEYRVELKIHFEYEAGD